MYILNDLSCLCPICLHCWIIVEYLCSPLIFSKIFVAQSLAFCVAFCRSLFVLLSFFFKQLYYLTFYLLLLIASLVSSDYLFGIFWLPPWYLLITSLVSSDYLFGIFWLPLWYLLITTLVSPDYPFGIFWLPFGIFSLPLWYLQTFLSNRAALTSIGPIAPYLAPRWSYLL